MLLLIFVLLVALASSAFAQLAVETVPGVRHYGDGTMSVETIPGHHRFSGAVEGSVTEIMPGVTHYNLRQNPMYSDDYARQSQQASDENVRTFEQGQQYRRELNRQTDDWLQGLGRQRR